MLEYKGKKNTSTEERETKRSYKTWTLFASLRLQDVPSISARLVARLVPGVRVPKAPPGLVAEMAYVRILAGERVPAPAHHEHAVELVRNSAFETRASAKIENAVWQRIAGYGRPSHVHRASCG